MITRAIAFFFTGLFFYSTANACSLVEEVFTEAQFYRAISPKIFDTWDVNEEDVGLVYVEKIREEYREPPSDDSGQTRMAPYLKLGFNLIENISGNFKSEDDGWYPKLSTEEAKKEASFKAKKRNFAFWDRHEITMAKVRGYGQMTSCGEQLVETMLPGNYYLQFKRDNRIVGLEIVTGPDDPLVVDIRNIYEGKLPNKISRDSEDYFRDIDGYSIAEIIYCPPIGVEFHPFYGFGYSDDGSDLNDKTVFRNLSSYNSSAKDVRLIDFYSYLSFVQKQYSCELGQKFLVLDITADWSSRAGNFRKFGLTPPKNRFLKIDRGYIDIDDVLSHITINNEFTISVSQVQNWIEQGQTQ